ncbi:hypothetical protein BDV95DRAFT_594485 [Massariosphaeria phaeospora]|uniref:Uncharacterized protein n=1 Tax=Massariosphaeria phaeospora TaxID=100035 RepID=A0A7C8I7M6_9PLEO|nr:hypothetical protein BDV95DRAFT_594485 [Massariosphaeria phaeospora]
MEEERLTIGDPMRKSFGDIRSGPFSTGNAAEKAGNEPTISSSSFDRNQALAKAVGAIPSIGLPGMTGTRPMNLPKTTGHPPATIMQMPHQKPERLHDIARKPLIPNARVVLQHNEDVRPRRLSSDGLEVVENYDLQRAYSRDAPEVVKNYELQRAYSRDAPEVMNGHLMVQSRPRVEFDNSNLEAGNGLETPAYSFSDLKKDLKGHLKDSYKEIKRYANKSDTKMFHGDSKRKPTNDR